MLRELGLTPEQIAFTGDGDTDMAFASALGFWALGASWGYRPRTVLAEQGRGRAAGDAGGIAEAVVGIKRKTEAQRPPLDRGGLCGATNGCPCEHERSAAERGWGRILVDAAMGAVALPIASQMEAKRTAFFSDGQL